MKSKNNKTPKAAASRRLRPGVRSGQQGRWEAKQQRRNPVRPGQPGARRPARSREPPPTKLPKVRGGGELAAPGSGRSDPGGRDPEHRDRRGRGCAGLSGVGAVREPLMERVPRGVEVRPRGSGARAGRSEVPGAAADPARLRGGEAAGWGGGGGVGGVGEGRRLGRPRPLRGHWAAAAGSAPPSPPCTRPLPLRSSGGWSGPGH